MGLPPSPRNPHARGHLFQAGRRLPSNVVASQMEGVRLSGSSFFTLGRGVDRFR